MESEATLSSADVCRYLQVPKGTVYRLVAAGKLQAQRRGRLLYFAVADVEEFLERTRIHPGDLAHLRNERWLGR